MAHAVTRATRLAALAMLLSACTGDDPDGACPDDACDDDGSAPGAPFGDAGIPAVEAEQACAMQSTRAERGVERPVDIIFVIDNSGSMTDEIAAVRRNINRNFARIIEDSGVDFRVIMLSLFGTDAANVCIDPPLAGNACDVGLYGTNSERYFHYNVEIASFDPWCRILESLDGPDVEGRAPNGWLDWLRPDSEKAFVLITDDSAGCSYGGGSEGEVVFGAVGADPFEDALLFHQTLLAKSPEYFGVPPDVRYTFYSIVGVEASEPSTEPWFPHQPVRERACDTAASAGRSYQALSVVTDALRYPVCEGRDFDAVFQVLAGNVVESAKAECVFEIPEAPPGQGIDLLTINVQYTPGDGGAAMRFGRARAEARCDASSFTIDGDRIRLCREACALVESDRAAQVDVLYACVVSPD